MTNFMWGDFIFLVVSLLVIIAVCALVIYTYKVIRKQSRKNKALEQRISQLEEKIKL